jgi:diguanylate cyclase (GGDEF)-like protein
MTLISKQHPERRKGGLAGLPDEAIGLLQTALNLCDFGAGLMDADGKILVASHRLIEWLGALSGNKLGKTIWDLIPDAQRDYVRDKIAGVGESQAMSFDSCVLVAGAESLCSLEVRLAATKPQTILAFAFRLNNPHAALPPYSSSDPRTDPLTSLPDRAFVMERLKSLFPRTAKVQPPLALLFIDIDDFKQVNDRFGHLVGDQVLREVAQRLAGCVRSGDHVARFGGDEFVVLVGGIGGRGAQAIMNRIRVAFLEPFALPQGELKLSLSIGAAEPDSQHGAPEDLLRAADQAMYAAKREKP